jgi:cytochrome d ubiquinol oxidase subunit II
MLPLFISYATLKVLAWIIVGLFIIVFAITDGWDLGVGMLLPFVGKTDDERRVVLNIIGPTWEGNQVWFIAGGALIFAVWPLAYGTAFSAFYLVLMLALWALFLRPIGFEYRSKLPSLKWRMFWDQALFVGSLVPSLLFGAAFGNLLLGVSFELDDTMRSFYTGHLWNLLHPFALLCGLVSVAMLMSHGASFLQMRTEGVIQERAHKRAVQFAILYIVLFAVAGLWIALGIVGIQITAIPDLNTSFLPQAKTVEVGVGYWLSNYVRYPWLQVIPMIAFIGAIVIILNKRHKWIGFVGSCCMVVGTILTAACSLFPFIVPSRAVPVQSLTIWDSVATAPSLQMIILFTITFLPIIGLYTFWVYRKLWGKVAVEEVKHFDSMHY